MRFILTSYVNHKRDRSALSYIAEQTNSEMLLFWGLYITNLCHLPYL